MHLGRTDSTHTLPRPPCQCTWKSRGWTSPKSRKRRLPESAKSSTLRSPRYSPRVSSMSIWLMYQLLRPHSGMNTLVWLSSPHHTTLFISTAVGNSISRPPSPRCKPGLAHFFSLACLLNSLNFSLGTESKLKLPKRHPSPALRRQCLQWFSRLMNKVSSLESD